MKQAIDPLVNYNDKVQARKSMLKIKEFADLCGCSIYTLRYYDEIDLLKPMEVNEISGYRYYSEKQIDQYLKIKEFQEIGLSVEEIKKIDTLNQKEILEIIVDKVDELQKRLNKSICLIQKYLKMNHEEEKK